MTQQTPKEKPKVDLEEEMFELEQQLDIPTYLRWHNKAKERMYSEEDMVVFLDWFNSYNNEVSAYRLSCTMKNEPFDSKVIFSMWLKNLKNNNYD